ncbi:O-methyltransferase [Brevibacillus reuszeri]|uniref:Methyltransferase n=1 Tax=Brevibacillus reuszeri TaxID=54915 RepID=A0A0K9YUB5_9BACL|nr:O-methyltransferase [Brevibacillus reuszeri]KNB72309.1 methyltransferase [Brevibacillus reuszeri]MED1861045.1 O-methyltransferase [Brevibacillus reuszeri]GED72890.1 O-methyltransferase [Brevibacillus reuszeri]
MSKETWTAVDRYFTDLLLPTDPILDATLQANAEAGLPSIDVAPNQGKLLNLFAQIQGARTILEIGTLGGYSTIWLARALPADGRLITLEANPHHAQVARKNLEHAGLDHLVEIRLGDALDSLAQLDAEGLGPFDLFFMDADKQSNSEYFQWALNHSRKGSLIITDNVVRNGRVVDEASTDPSVLGVRRFAEHVAAEPRVSATALQTVGSKGYDGFAIAVVTEEI